MLIIKTSNIYKNKFFILGLLILSIVVYLIIFRSVKAPTTLENELMNELVNLSFLDNFLVQMAINFVGNFLGVYIGSLLLFLFIFLGCKISNKQVTITISNLINIYYLSLYVVMFDLLFKSINMLITRSVFESAASSFLLVYAVIISVAEAFVVIYFCRKKFNYLIAPIVYFSLGIVYQIFSYVVYNNYTF